MVGENLNMLNNWIAYGFWRYSRDEKDTAIAMVEAAREAGITHFDAADCYGESGFGDVELLLGDARRAAPSLFDGVEIATKAGVEFGTPYNSSAEYIQNAVDASLARMGVEQVGLFYIHRPDILAHPEEVAGALDAVIAAGKAAAIGVSNYSPAQVDALSKYLKAPVSAHQVEFSALHTAPIFDGAFDQAMALRLRVFAWSPLGGGALLHARGERAGRIRAALENIGAVHNVGIVAAALAFIMAHPSRPVPIIGTKKPDRLKDAVDAQSVSLTRREWYGVLQAALGADLP